MPKIDDEIDAGYVPLQAPEPRRRASWRWSAGIATAAAALVAGVALGSTGGGGKPPNRPVRDAGCAGPVLRVKPRTVRAGHRVTLTGKYYVTGCRHDPAQEAPMANVPLTLMDSGGGLPVRLTVAHPRGHLGTFSVVATIPTGTPTGRASVSDGGSASVSVDVS